MVFELFFGKNSEFTNIKKELKKAEILDKILENLLNNKEGYEKTVKRKIQSTIIKLEQFINKTREEIQKDEENLKKYITTSIEQVDYLKEINNNLNEISLSLNTIKQTLNTKEYITFIDETITSREKIKQDIQKLEQIMEQFNEQSKNSLEWNYKGGTNQVDYNDFIKKVSALGGKIEFQSATSHFKVIFKLFTNTISKSQKSKHEIAAGTLSSFIKTREPSIIPYLDPKYLKCYFFHNNKTFEKIFITKYKTLFKI